MPDNKVKLVLDLDDKGFIKAVSGDIKAVGALQKKLNVTGATGKKSVKGLSSAFGGLSRELKTLVGIGSLSAVAVGLAKITSESIKAASAAEETQAKFNTVFRGIQRETNAWAEGFASDVGRSREEIKRFSSNIADVLKPMGLQTDAAAEMSKKMVQLALDVASFNNRQDADVLRAFTSALTGERESLKTLGIVINEADVKQEAYRAGLAKTGEALSKTAKAQATVNLLFKNTADAQGDLARTQDSYANQRKRFQGEMANLGETLGNVLLPAATKTVTIFGKMAGALDENIRFMKDLGDVSLTAALKMELAQKTSIEILKRLPKLLGDAATGGISGAIAKNIGEISSQAALNFVEDNLAAIEKLEKDIAEKAKEKADAEEAAAKAIQAQAESSEIILKNLRALNEESALQKITQDVFNKYFKTPRGTGFGNVGTPTTLPSPVATNIDLTTSVWDRLNAMLVEGEYSAGKLARGFTDLLYIFDLGDESLNNATKGVANFYAGITQKDPLQVIVGFASIFQSFIGNVDDGEEKVEAAARAQERYNNALTAFGSYLSGAGLAETLKQESVTRANVPDWVFDYVDKVLDAGYDYGLAFETLKDIIKDPEDLLAVEKWIAAMQRLEEFETYTDGFSGNLDRLQYLTTQLGLTGDEAFEAITEYIEKILGIDLGSFFNSPTDFMQWYETYLQRIAGGQNPVDIVGQLFPGGIPEGLSPGDIEEFISYLKDIATNTKDSADSTEAQRLDDENFFSLSQSRNITVQQANDLVASNRAILSEHQKTNKFLEEIKGGALLSLGTLQTFTNLVTVKAAQAQIDVNNANVNILNDGNTTKDKVSRMENEQFLSVNRA